MSYWKASERKIGKFFGVGRNSKTALGDRSGVSDLRTDRLDIECKARKDLPAWFTEPFKQAQRNAKDGRIPLVIWHVKGEEYRKAMVVIGIEDFIRLYEGEKEDGREADADGDLKEDECDAPAP